MNLSAPFVLKFYVKTVAEVLPYVDVLFGNESEAVAFAESFNLGTMDVVEIAKKIANWPKVKNFLNFGT